MNNLKRIWNVLTLEGWVVFFVSAGLFVVAMFTIGPLGTQKIQAHEGLYHCWLADTFKECHGRDGKGYLRNPSLPNYSVCVVRAFIEYSADRGMDWDIRESDRICKAQVRNFENRGNQRKAYFACMQLDLWDAERNSENEQ